MEKLKTRCEQCQKKISYEPRFAGRKVKCPGCQQPVQLPAASTSTEVFIDPFAELREEPAAPVAPSTAKPERTRSPRREEKVPKQQSTAETTDRVAEKKTSTADASTQSAEQQDDIAEKESRFDEPYIDEFGLAELDLNEAETHSSASMPPVSKEFVRKKPRRKEEPDSVKAPESNGKARSAERKDVVAKRFRPADSSTGHGRRRIYVVLLMTLLPLIFTLLTRDRDELEKRLADGDEPAAEAKEEENGDPPLFEEAGDDPADEAWDPPPEEAEPNIAVNDADDIFDMFPGKRIPGALLARDSSLHWVFAALSGVAYFALFIAMFRSAKSPLSTALFATFFTATIGILMLICFQGAAFATQGFWLRGRGLVGFVFLIIKFIGFSYRCALEEGNGFLLSFVGFTCGVGVCEEICKILPVIGYLGKSEKPSWQGACLIGLASGVGFGVAEGIMYSSRYYNGIATGDIYLVRFISCVALHAVWSGAGAVLLYFNQDGLHGGFSFTDLASTLLMTQGISIIMHGLYDTLLKQEFPIFALLIGIASVGWLIYVFERLAGDEDESVAIS